MHFLPIAISSLFALRTVYASPTQVRHSFKTKAVEKRGISGYESIGCYSEATNGRALSSKSYYDDNMTLETCQMACAGYDYFGIEYGRECYCGNNLNAGSVSTPPSECSFSCPGDSAQRCGAGNRLNVYHATGAAAGEVDFSKYDSRGCYTEPTTGRALDSKTTRLDDMTIDKCAAICGDAKYSLFGLEYYTECYCANKLAPETIQASTEDCKFPCAGDNTQTCGGDWRFNLFEFGRLPAPTPIADFSDIGCYTDNTQHRALTGKAYYDDNMTVTKCATACGGFTYFGIEYARECFCGNKIVGGSVSTARAECSFPCPGNEAEKCGAGDRLNMFRAGPVTSTTTTMSSSTTSIGTSSTTTSEAITTWTDLPSTTTTLVSSTSTEISSSTTTTPTTSSSSQSATSESSSVQLTSSSTAVVTTTSESPSALPSTTLAPTTSSESTTSEASTLQSTTSSTTTVVTTTSESISTTTSSPTPSPTLAPTLIAGLVVASGPQTGRTVFSAENSIAQTLKVATSGLALNSVFTRAGGVPYLADKVDFKLYTRLSTTQYGILFFATPAYVLGSSFTWRPTSCSVATDGTVACSTSTGLGRVLQCGLVLYLAANNVTPGGCIAVTLKAT